MTVDIRPGQACRPKGSSPGLGEALHRGNVDTEQVSDRGVYSRSSVYTDVFEHGLYTQKFLHGKNCSTGKFFNNREAFQQKHVAQRYTKSFDTQTDLHTEAVRERSRYTGKCLHIIAHRQVYTEKFLHTGACIHRLAHTEI